MAEAYRIVQRWSPEIPPVISRSSVVSAFGIDLPVFTGGRIKNEIAEAQANLARIHAAREEMAQDIRLEVQSAYNELVSSIGRRKIKSFMPVLAAR